MKNLKSKRIIDTFPAMNLQLKYPDAQNTIDSLNEYSLKKGYGLDLIRRRRKHKQIVL